MIHPLQTLMTKEFGKANIVNIQKIQNLWSGYGELNRVILEDKSIIVKLIKFPNKQDHPRGWSSDFGHERKKKSYQIETYWYQHYNDAKGAITPKCLGHGHIDDYQYLILEDLQELHFHVKHSLSWEEIQKCLLWLASFHRHYLNTNPDGLWEIGTYWHLATRPEELEVMTDLKLKDAAPKIDQMLNNAQFKTLVHGDAKLANFLFNDKEVAAVDFQYVGGGAGIKDVAYFLSSIYDEKELKDREQSCLETYFTALNLPEVEKEWRELYPFAWCDFYRFLQGWSPGHWKMNSYSENMKEKVLACL